MASHPRPMMLSVATILARSIQVLGLVAGLVALQQVLPLRDAIAEAWQAPDGSVSFIAGRVLAVTVPLGISLFLIGSIQVLLRHQSQYRQRREQWKDQPWMIHPMWEAKHIRLSNRPVVIAFAILGIVFLFLIVPFMLMVQKTPFYWIFGGLGLVSLLILRVFWLNRRWNQAELHLETLPGIVGGPFGGMVTLHQSFPPDAVFDVTLQCEQTEVIRREKSSESKKTVLWRSMLQIRQTGQTQIHRCFLPVYFAIPYECKGTEEDSQTPIRWRLEVKRTGEVSMGGASFEVPVFRTAESRPDFQSDTPSHANAMAGSLVTHDPLTILKRYNYQRTSQGNRETLTFSEYDVTILVPLVVIALICVAILIAIFVWVSSWNGIFVAALLPAAFLVMVVYGVGIQLFWKCIIELQRPKETRLDDEHFAPQVVANKPLSGRIRAESGIVGFRKSLKVTQANGVLKVAISHRGEQKDSWSIGLEGPASGRVLLIPSLQSAAEASAIQQWLAQELGLTAIAMHAGAGFASDSTSKSTIEE